MTELSDEQLCELARSGNSTAADILAARYISLIGMRASAYRPVSGSFDRDDLGQEGFIGLIGAINSYDASFGASFRTFALLNIDRRITDAVRASLRKHRVPDSAKVDTDVSSDFCDPEHTAIVRDTLQRIRNELEHNASELERNVFRLYLCGYSYAEAAKRLNCTPKAVENALSRIRRKLTGFKLP